eukprot:6174034-Pleurochrysis_carterae.AAC.1
MLVRGVAPLQPRAKRGGDEERWGEGRRQREREAVDRQKGGEKNQGKEGARAQRREREREGGRGSGSGR